jgi:3-hydroxypropanoate dehydrogenase
MEARMGDVVDDNALDTLFRKARTHFKWLPRPIEDQTLHELYELRECSMTCCGS